MAALLTALLVDNNVLSPAGPQAVVRRPVTSCTVGAPPLLPPARQQVTASAAGPAAGSG